ncbi:MAG: hypothetical protein WBX25_03465 [Rhodomicrobium sp.]
MSNDNFLREVLRAHEIEPDSPEMRNLQDARKEVEGVLRDAFSDCSPTIRYGGSKAKGTMVLEDYDLDVVCYFPRNGSRGGETIKEIYFNVRDVLGTSYSVVEKTAALRVKNHDVDLFIDVIPGRFIDDSETDTFLHQNGGEKDWLKTNLDKQVAHVRDSGCTSEIRLMKLWRPCMGLSHVRTFPLELLVIKIIQDTSEAGLENRLAKVLSQIRDNIDGITIRDPANADNDLTDALSPEIRQSLSRAAWATLLAVERTGWQPIFRSVMGAGFARREETRISVTRNEPRTAPWSSDPK